MRVEALTFLRFFAAIVVVFYHFGKNTNIALYAKPFIISGTQLVTFFFVLSGFVMMISQYNKKNQTLRNYYVARFARIFPVYIIAFLLMVYFTYGKENNNLTSLLLSITFLQSWLPPYPLSFNSPGWSLSVEALFYISFPFVLFIIKSSRISCVKLITFTVSFYLVTQVILSALLSSKFHSGYPSTGHDLINYFPLSHLCSFLLGVSGGYLYLKHSDHFHRRGLIPIIILVIMFAATYLLLQYPKVLVNLIGFPLAYSSSFYALIFLLLILSIAYSKSFITTILSMPALVSLGEYSYALYILQKPVHILYEKYILYNLEMSVSVQFYMYLAILILVSLVAYHLIEKPGKMLVFKINAYIGRKQSDRVI